MLKRKRISSVLTALLPVFLSIAEPSNAESRPEPSRQVATTLPPLAWLISRVAGPDFEVAHLVNPGDLPETFQPTDRQITHIARSAIFFRVGIPAENGPWLSSLEKTGRLRIVDLRRGIELRKMENHHHGTSHGDSHRHETDHGDGHQAGSDPHIWLSPQRLEVMAWVVSRSLSTLNPADAEGYARRAGRLTAELRALDEELKRRLRPIRGRSFFVFHPSWGYLADDYGLEQISIEIEGKVPTERELTHLVRQAKTLGMRTLFVQPQVRSSAPEILARTVGAQVETLDPLARNVPANLLSVADRLVTSLKPPASQP